VDNGLSESLCGSKLTWMCRQGREESVKRLRRFGGCFASLESFVEVSNVSASHKGIS
jgi:hypothetical protein